jgi:hypothetical protein
MQLETIAMVKCKFWKPSQRKELHVEDVGWLMGRLMVFLAACGCEPGGVRAQFNAVSAPSICIGPYGPVPQASSKVSEKNLHP